MQSTYLSRSLFGCTRISLIIAALFVGTLRLPAMPVLKSHQVRRGGLLNLPAWPSTRGCLRLCVS